MRMPKVDLTPSSHGPDYVHFRSRCGRVAGVALRKQGCSETTYDVSDPKRVDPSMPVAMIALPDTVATFEVVGIVEFLFNDGLAVVAAHGFTFWVGRDEIEVVLELGDHVACRVTNFALWV